MRNRIFGGIGVAWGGAMLIASIMNGGPQGQGAYLQGQWIGLVFGVVMFGAGLYYLITGGGTNSNNSKSAKSTRSKRR